MSNQKIWLLRILILVSLTRCVTKTPINDVMVPLNSIREVIRATVPMGIKSESMNGRELKSGFFKSEDFEEVSEDDRIRAYALVTILGERRPYQIDVKVIRELRERVKGEVKFKSLGVDKRSTARLVEMIKEALANRPADRNVIDDFKPF